MRAEPSASMKATIGRRAPLMLHLLSYAGKQARAPLAAAAHTYGALSGQQPWRVH